MRAVLTDGTELHCENFKALDSGVLLTKDRKRKQVVGFVPHGELRYVASEAVDVVDRQGTSQRPAAESATDEDVDENEDTDASGSESVGDETAGDEDAAPVSVAASVDANESELRRLGGLGSTYADRLHTAGYETLTDLATADPVEVAAAASVSPGRGRRWVDAAKRVTAAEGRAGAEQTDEAEKGDAEGHETDRNEEQESTSEVEEE